MWFLRSVVEPGMWSNTSITNPNSTAKVTIQCAIHEWNQHLRKRFQSSSYPVRYSDNCIGAICNPQCPESILLGVLGELWPDPVKYLVVTIVLAVTVLSLVYKVVMMWKKYRLFKSYEHFTGDKDTTDTVSWFYLLCIIVLQKFYIICLHFHILIRILKFLYLSLNSIF